MKEGNVQHLAYQLLTEKYLPSPNIEELELFNKLFQDWAQSGKESLLGHLFEIIDTHESQKIRDIALKSIKKYYPKNKLDDVLELWINHPTPSLREYIKSIIKENEISKPLLAAIYIMIDELELLDKLDPDFIYLDTYLKDLDPLVGSLLIARVNQLKSFLKYEKEFDNFIDKVSVEEETSIIDKIHSKDYDFVWERILQFPLPFICELVKIFSQENWQPKNASDIPIYEMLLEELNDKGWIEVEGVIWNAVSIQRNKKFFPLTDNEIKDRNFNFYINDDLIHHPDRIESRKFVSRGRFNLVHPDIDLYIYHSSIRRSEIDGILHIPIFSSNGVEIAEFTIPALSTNAFNIDEDGLYFTVRNKNGLFSVDLDVLAAILLPVSKHSEAITEVIATMKERASSSTILTIEAIDLLSTLHRGREFSLWDLKRGGKLISEEVEEEIGCGCIFGLDLGDTTTKLSFIPSKTCEIDTFDIQIPSLIHYFTPTDFIIGDEVVKKNLLNSSQTFTNWKSGIYSSQKKFIRIMNVIISAHTALENYITKLFFNLNSQLNHTVEKIIFTYPMDFPLTFQNWISNILQKNGFNKIIFVEDLCAALVGSYIVENQRGNVLLIDIGSSNMSAVIADLSGAKSRKRIKIERIRERKPITPDIIARVSTLYGSLDINQLLKSSLSNPTVTKEDIEKYEKLKTDLAFNFSSTLKISRKSYQFSIDEKYDEGSIDFRNTFLNSDVFTAFQKLLRNVLILSAKRGITKDKIDTILIMGQGANWPLFLEYIVSIFKKQEIIIEDDLNLVAKGALVFGYGQAINFILERDYMLRTTSDGRTNYSSLLNRGEQICNQFKEFQINLLANFERIVLDCWSRKVKFTIKGEEMPITDNDRTEFRRDDLSYFHYDKIIHTLGDITKESILRIELNHQGKLNFILQTEKEKILIPTKTYIH